MATRTRKRAVRLSAGLVVTVCLVALLASFVASPSASQPDLRPAGNDGPTPPESAASSQSNGREITVISTQGFYVGNHPGDRNVAELIAITGDGRTLYHDKTHQVYYDIDPVPGTRATVEYVAADRIGGERCAASQCSRNLIERVNLTTGNVTTVYSAITPKFDGGRWHDVDRLNETHLVIADIVYDRVIVVDIPTHRVVWQWNASDRYSPTAGGSREDWTHLNDVEVLPDGRIMASVRNMDQVVFIAPSTEVVESDWTLGTDNDHETLYEQHNPDYIPTDRGGPAVLLADSENNRVIEYHRRNGSWVEAWSWRDPTLQWPRDADRLPTGSTLIVDSHGDRVLEIGPNGSIVWSVSIGRPYDAERLGTDDESRTGFAAGSKPNCASGVHCAAPPAIAQGKADQPSLIVSLKDALPPVAVNSLLFIAPPWLQFTDLLIGSVLVITATLWGSLEWIWSDRSLRTTLARLRPSR